ncbi:unnamed protein product [Rhodiola kirilowii]
MASTIASGIRSPSNVRLNGVSSPLCTLPAFVSLQFSSVRVGRRNCLSIRATSASGSAAGQGILAFLSVPMSYSITYHFKDVYVKSGMESGLWNSQPDQDMFANMLRNYLILLNSAVGLYTEELVIIR